MLESYSKVYHWGHAQLDVLKTTANIQVSVQEKIDGSQISFGRDANGVFHVRSKNASIDISNPPDLFRKVSRYLASIQSKMEKGVTYRAEVISALKHNTLIYSKTPKNNLILFDVDIGNQHYEHPDKLEKHAEKLGIDSIGVLYSGVLPDREKLNSILENNDSMLGGEYGLEGLVVKPVDAHIYDARGKLLMGKLVKKDFIEMNKEDWAKRHPKGKNFVENMSAGLRSEARWDKAIQRMKETGELTSTASDIGTLLNLVKDDICEEEEEYIKNQLWSHYKRDILSQATRGLPEWYKEKLNDPRKHNLI